MNTLSHFLFWEALQSIESANIGFPCTYLILYNFKMPLGQNPDVISNNLRYFSKNDILPPQQYPWDLEFLMPFSQVFYQFH